MRSSLAVADRTAVEDAYRRFLRESASIWLWILAAKPLLVFFTPVLIFDIARGIRHLPNIDPIVDRIEDVGFYWVAPLALAFFVYRGRSAVRSMLVGRLRPLSLAITAIVAASIGVAYEYVYLRIDHGAFDFFSLHGPILNGQTFFALVTAPLGEEFFFQAVLQTALQRAGPYIAVAVTTGIFVFWHISIDDIAAGNVTAASLLQRLGALATYAIVRQTTKSLGAAIGAHVLVNLAVLTTLT